MLLVLVQVKLYFRLSTAVFVQCYASHWAVLNLDKYMYMYFSLTWYYNLLYVELAISFLIRRKRTVDVRNQCLWCHNWRLYTNHVIRTLKVTGNHVMYDRSAWFLRVVMSSLRALCCLPSEKEQKSDFNFFRSMYNKTIIIRFGFVISRIIEVSVRDNPYLDLDYSLSNNCLVFVWCWNVHIYIFIWSCANIVAMVCPSSLILKDTHIITQFLCIILWNS